MNEDKKSQGPKKPWDKSLQDIFDQFALPWKKADEKKTVEEEKYPAFRPLPQNDPKQKIWIGNGNPSSGKSRHFDSDIIAEMMAEMMSKRAFVTSNSDLNNHKATLESNLGPAYVLVINTILFLPEDSTMWNDVPINYLVEMAIQRLEMERPDEKMKLEDFLRRMTIPFDKKFPRVRGQKLAKELDLL